MAQSNDAGHYFQTSDSLETTKRKAAKASNKRGKPVTLPSKILAVYPDPRHEGAVLVAEAAGSVKKVALDTDKATNIYTQATAPLTSLAFCSRSNAIFAGCWDKHVHAISQAKSGPLKLLSGHTDFVKCLLTTSLNGTPVLISGGADSSVIVWDSESGKQLHKLKTSAKAIQDLAIDPESIQEGSLEPAESLVLFEASNGREIRRYHISLESAYELSESVDKPIIAHETSIYKIRFDSEGDLWTASADKTAKHLVRSRDWEADTILQHPDFVRDIVVAEDHSAVVTACRDEDVRVWNISSGNLLCTYSGHFEEVTGLALMGAIVVSGSIDGTVRRWGLRKQDMEQYQEELKREAEGDAADGAKKEGMLTADEEAELAELMDEDD